MLATKSLKIQNSTPHITHSAVLLAEKATEQKNIKRSADSCIVAYASPTCRLTTPNLDLRSTANHRPESVDRRSRTRSHRYLPPWGEKNRPNQARERQRERNGFVREVLFWSSDRCWHVSPCVCVCVCALRTRWSLGQDKERWHSTFAVTPITSERVCVCVILFTVAREAEENSASSSRELIYQLKTNTAETDLAHI